MNQEPDFAVAEVCANWTNGRLDQPELGHLAERFERVLRTNHERGYQLLTMTLSQYHLVDPAGVPHLTETLIAVFVLRRRPKKGDLHGNNLN